MTHIHMTDHGDYTGTQPLTHIETFWVVFLDLKIDSADGLTICMPDSSPPPHPSACHYCVIVFIPPLAD